MADEPISMTDRLLRDIQATLSEHTRLLTDQAANIRDMRREMREWQETTAIATGFAGHANVRAESLQKQIDGLSERLARIEERR